METIIIGLKTNTNCQVIVYCHLHSHKYFQKDQKILSFDVNSPWPRWQSASWPETGETNIIFAPGLSSNKYFGCWAQTKWPWPPATAEPSQGVFSLNGQKQQQTCFLFLRILNKKWGRDALWKLEKL